MKTQLFSRLFIGATLFGQVATAQTWKWVALTSGTANNLNGVQFLDANNGFACGDAGTVLKTTNGGSTWSPINISTSYPVRQVSFTSTTQGYAAVGDPSNYTTTGQMWVTANGGVTWTSVTWPGGAYANLSVKFFNSTTGYLGSTHYTGGTGTDTYYTANGGTSWTSNSANIDWNWIYDMSYINTTTGWTVGDNTTEGCIFYTNNNGTSWTVQYGNPSGGPVTPFLYGISFLNANVGFVCGQSGTLLATTNGGTTWSPQTSGTTNQLNGNAMFSINIGWAVGTSGTIIRTINGGTNWNAETSGTAQNLNAISDLDSNTAWAVGDAGTILKREYVNGIEEINNASVTMTLYPNPFNSSATILIERQSIKNSRETGMLRIYDMFGKEVKCILVNLAGQKTEIGISMDNFSSGLYIYRFESGANTLGEGKFLIN